MNTLILNGLSNRAFTILSYNRNTSFDNNTHAMNSVAYFDIVNTTGAINNLQSIGATGVNNILIKHDEENIYNLTNLNANISSINENLYEDNVHINVCITFN